MRMKVFVSTVAILVFAITALGIVFAAEGPVDATLSKPVPRYTPTLGDRAYNAVTAGDVAEGDVVNR